MSRILLLSFHYPPFNVIASQRAFSFAQHLPKYGFEVDVVTMDWQKLPDNQGYAIRKSGEVKEEQAENGTVYRLPSKSQNSSNPNKIKQLKRWKAGLLDDPNLDAVHQTYLSFLEKHLSSQKYDFALGIYSPHMHLNQCGWINKKYGIPYALDFRDLWSNRIIHEAYQPGFGLKVEDYFIAKHWTKSLAKASFATITSQPWADKLQSFTSTPVHVVTNGFFLEEKREHKPIQNEKIQLAYMGSIYNNQEWDEVVNLLNAHKDEVHIHFIGSDIDSSGAGLTARMANPKAFLEKQLKCAFTITPKVEREEALAQLDDADALLFASFPKSPGTFSGRIFEYLATGKPILSIPKDNGVIDQLLEKTQAGWSIQSKDELNFALKKIKEGNLPKRKEERIDHYSRTEQAGILAALIKQSLA